MESSSVATALAPAMPSPSSDERFWNMLRDRVDTILDQKWRPRQSSSSSVESEVTGKRLREEDTLLLMSGFDSTAASLSYLTTTLTAAQQGLHDLAKPSLTNLQQTEIQGTEGDGDVKRNPKRHCGSDKDQETVSQETDPFAEAVPAVSKEVAYVAEEVRKCGNLKKAKNLAISMASKANSLARELKTIKSELQFMRERCDLLEEENRRLRDGAEKGQQTEEDDLVRLQLEALLAEKSRLANDNSNLIRENQCLHQLVEYHQLATQDLPSPSYEQAIRGVCLDFSSPNTKADRNLEDESINCEDPSRLYFGLIASVDEKLEEVCPP